MSVVIIAVCSAVIGNILKNMEQTTAMLEEIRTKADEQAARDYAEHAEIKAENERRAAQDLAAMQVLKGVPCNAR